MKNLLQRIVAGLLAGAGLLPGACADQSVITHVNQHPLFQPSLISYGAREGGVPMEIHGALPAGFEAAALAKAVHFPGRAEGVRLVTEPIGHAAPPSLSTPVPFIKDRLETMMGFEGHEVRLVLIFSPHFQTLPDWACSAADQIPMESRQDIRLMAAFCAGAHLAASGQLRLPSAAATPENLARAVNVLISDMSRPPVRGGFNSRNWH